MTFARYFKFWCYCLITAGFIALAMTGSVDAPSLVLFSIVLTASFFIDTARATRQIPRWLFNALASLYLIFYVLDFRYISRSFVLSTIHLIFFVAAVKLLTHSSDRDFAFLYLLSFAELLAASTLTVDITFSIILFVFLLSATGTLMLFEIKSSHARAQREGGIEPLVVPRGIKGTGLELFAPFPFGSIFVLSLAAAVAILLLSVPFFLLLPRISLGIYGRPSGKTQFVSGFSEHVELGEIGSIKQSDAVVMRVRMAETPVKLPADLKWRGIALESYDGRSWSRPRWNRRPISANGRFFQVEGAAEGTNFLWQTFFLEAISTDVIFGTNKVLAISNDLPFLQRDASGSLFSRRHEYTKIRYTVLSEIRQPDPGMVYADQRMIPPEIQRCCLQLPSLDPRIARLAAEVTRSALNPHEKAKTIESFLKDTYRYSLDLKGSKDNPDPLAMFLFDVREGHCEYFATAMAIMLRELGTPARIVNGFRAGEYNSLGEGWIVRQYDAHSWVEAYFLPYGWLEFDPTPAAPPLRRSALAGVIAQYLDAVDLWWAEEVVNYDIWKQFTLISNTRSRLEKYQTLGQQLWRAAWEKSRAVLNPARISGLFTRTMTPWLLSFGVSLGLAASLLILRKDLCFRLMRWPRHLLHRRDQRILIVDFYREALNALARRGLRRGSSQTPLEFAAELGEGPLAACFCDLTHLYNRIRFSGRSRAEDVDEAQRLVRLLRLSLHNTGASDFSLKSPDGPNFGSR